MLYLKILYVFACCLSFGFAFYLSQYARDKQIQGQLKRIDVLKLMAAYLIFFMIWGPIVAKGFVGIEESCALGWIRINFLIPWCASVTSWFVRG